MNRRRVLAAVTGVMATAALPSAASVHGADARPKGDKPGDFETYIRVRGATDDRIVFWWVRGRRFGVLGSRTTPFFESISGNFARYVRQPDGTVKVTATELSYYFDFESGEPLAQWLNPYTGRRVPVPSPTYVAITQSLAPDFPLPKTDEVGRRTIGASSILRPAWSDEQFVWLLHDTAATIEYPDGKTSPFQISETATYCARLADLSRNARWTPATVSYENVQSFRDWHQMGDQPGMILYRGYGAKVRSQEGLPQRWLQVARQRHPGIVADPAAALASKAFRDD
jgi:hypothetical protein